MDRQRMLRPQKAQGCASVPTAWLEEPEGKETDWSTARNKDWTSLEGWGGGGEDLQALLPAVSAGWG